MVKAELLARAGYTYIGRLYSEMDCQAFVERCLLDCGLRMNLSGSNAWYRKMTWVGTPEECKAQFGKIPPGAFLFILDQDGGEPAKYRGDGIGNASHIGIYTGIRQGAIHSSASRGSVQESRFNGKSIKGGWNRVGLWDQIAYDTSINFGMAEEKSGMETDYVAQVTDGRLSLRTGPSTNSPRIAWIPDGDLVHVIEDCKDWKKVEWSGQTGYVVSSFLTAPGTEKIPAQLQERLQKIYDELGDILGLGG